MKVILLEEENTTATAFALGLRQLGHEVLHTALVEHATAQARLGGVDLLVAALLPLEAEAEYSGLGLAFAAQVHNPDLVSILLSDSAVFGGGELFDMLFSLRCVLPRPPRLNDLREIALHFSIMARWIARRSPVAPISAPAACWSIAASARRRLCRNCVWWARNNKTLPEGRVFVWSGR